MARQLSKPEPPAAPGRLTKAMFAEREELEAQRLELGRQASALGKQVAEIDKVFASYVDSHTSGKTRRVETCGYELAIEQKPKSPSWKSLFAKLAGPKKVKEAEEAAGTRDQLVIRKL